MFLSVARQDGTSPDHQVGLYIVIVVGFVGGVDGTHQKIYRHIRHTGNAVLNCGQRRGQGRGNRKIVKTNDAHILRDAFVQKVADPVDLHSQQIMVAENTHGLGLIFQKLDELSIVTVGICGNPQGVPVFQKITVGLQFHLESHKTDIFFQSQIFCSDVQEFPVAFFNQMPGYPLGNRKAVDLYRGFPAAFQIVTQEDTGNGQIPV